MSSRQIKNLSSQEVPKINCYALLEFGLKSLTNFKFLFRISNILSILGYFLKANNRQKLIKSKLKYDVEGTCKIALL
ncbi:hypothetical protein PBAT_08735 [Paenibacillus antarcticus]|uniref:Uncharacterized protein n=1 Tax=Paenibacillus antarcticus TaxID=253703 RepID=A0A168PH33_9BACL|nr:hypothetical protein PBAT_08735 [Paenibacillus antarcticus]